MATITIKVDQLYQEADFSQQEKLNNLIKLFLKPDSAGKTLSQVMKEINCSSS